MVERVILELVVPPAARAMLVALNDVVGPEGATDAERETVPVNPPRLVRVIAELLEEPISIFT